MKKKNEIAIKKLIIAKTLLQKSKELIRTDTIENNIVAIVNLNSALDIVLKVIEEKQKIRSIKQLNNISLEKQWSILTEEYKRKYGQDLSMKTQIFTLNTIIDNYTLHNQLPTNVQVHRLYQALIVFVEEIITKIFNISYTDLDFSILIDHPQLRQSIKNAQDAFESRNYEEVLKETSAAFHIALEEQRQKLNYLSEKGLLKPDLFMLESPIDLHIGPKDQDFIHLALKTPTKKLEVFKQFVPTVLIAEDDKARPEIIVSDYVDDSAKSKENAEFCLNFVLETILHWESIDLLKE